MLAICFSLHSVALLFLGARVLVKWKLKKLGLDDMLIIVSAVSHQTRNFMLYHAPTDTII